MPHTCPGEVLVTRLSPETTIPDVAPLSFRLRKAVLRLLPAAVINGLARLIAKAV